MNAARGQLVFVIGGARSGKSSFAEARVRELAPPWIYLATAQAFDDEMRARIDRHRAQRGEGWQTVEAPHDLAGALRAAPADARPDRGVARQGGRGRRAQFRQ